MTIMCGYKQHLSNIWSSILEKVKQDRGWVEKNVSYKKMCITFKQVLINWKIKVRFTCAFSKVIWLCWNDLLLLRRIDDYFAGPPLILLKFPLQL